MAHQRTSWENPTLDQGAFPAHTVGPRKGVLDTRHTHVLGCTHTHIHPHLQAQAVLTHRPPIEPGAAEQVPAGLFHTALSQKPACRLRHPPGGQQEALQSDPKPWLPPGLTTNLPNPPHLMNFYSFLRPNLKATFPHSSLPRPILHSPGNELVSPPRSQPSGSATHFSHR